MYEKQKDLAVIILIGGKSTRFGTDKAFVELLGKPLILHQIEILSKFDEDVFLVSRSEEQLIHYKTKIDFPKDVNFLVDEPEIFPHPKLFKPMVGIYSGFRELNKLGFKKGFLLSCDMPLIKPEVIDLMIKESQGYEFCIPRYKSGYLEPFFAIYPVEETMERAQEILVTKNYGLLNLLDEDWNTNYVSVEKKIQPLDDKLVSFLNINGPIDLIKAIKYYK